MNGISRRTLLVSAGALALGASVARVFAQSDATATLRVQAFGGDAELAGINGAIARFNQQYPNVTVEVSIAPVD